MAGTSPAKTSISCPGIASGADTPSAPTAEFVEADQSDLGCPVPFAKIFSFASDPNQFSSPAVSFHQRGVSRSSRTRGGMRWTLIAPLTNGAEADGEVVWS